VKVIVEVQSSNKMMTTILSCVDFFFAPGFKSCQPVRRFGDSQVSHLHCYALITAVQIRIDNELTDRLDDLFELGPLE
jgi:hypothetical protein